VSREACMKSYILLFLLPAAFFPSPGVLCPKRVVARRVTLQKAG
jgi:hypothetical protein